MRERIALLDQRGTLLAQENVFLRRKVDLLVRKVFGVSSEKLDPSQLNLFLLQTENAPGKSPASSALEEAALFYSIEGELRSNRSRPKLRAFVRARQAGQFTSGSIVS